MLRFVPEYTPPTKEVLQKFRDIIAGVDRLIVLTGAGISTESGIPDYRSEKVGQYARTNYRPVDHTDFMRNESWRKYYWSRNLVQYPSFSRSKPNIVHKTIAEWEKSDRFTWLITQNVDGLHTEAGSKKVTELHGCSRRVQCMNCKALYPRDEVQKWILEANPDWLEKMVGTKEPDGSEHLTDEAIDAFNVPHCPKCGPGSILKTDVVFFGDNLRGTDVSTTYEKLEESNGMLVLGSSLQVMTGYNIVRAAFVQSMPIVIVNIGATGADDLATMKIAAKCSDVVKEVHL
uniref:Deacetylase sirtuin-type domain-containing protein n=2 Tax=Ascaris TaxID=6251 RepID=A0A0M3INK0_ASCLU